MIDYVTGDATNPINNSEVRIIAHCCNDIGQWGSGFVVSLSKRWSTPEAAYRKWNRHEEHPYFSPMSTVKDSRVTKVPFKLGQTIFVEVEPNLWVANIIGQHRNIQAGEKVPIRYWALRQGLDRLYDIIRYERTATVHLPRIGADRARGDWNKIEAIIEDVLPNTSVTVYDLPKG